MAAAAADWGRARDINGTQTTVNRPLAFPLEMSKFEAEGLGHERTQITVVYLGR